MIPQGFGMLKEVFDDEELGRATRLFGPATGLAMLGAPILAGALIDADLWDTGWRLVFLINVPIGLIALPFAVRALPSGVSHPDLTLDIGGVGLVGLALVAIIYPLIQGQSDGWPAWTFVMLAAGAALLVAFTRYERTRSHNALIEPSLLTNRRYLSGVAVMVGLFGAFGGLLLCVSLFGQLGEGWSPIHAGLTLTPMVIGLIAGMVVSGMFVERLGRHLLHIGILLIAAGTITLAVNAHRRGRSLDLGSRPRPVAGRCRGRQRPRPDHPVHPCFGQHERGRIRLRRHGSLATAVDPHWALPSWARSSSRCSDTTWRPTPCGSPRGSAWCRSPPPSALVFLLPKHASEAAGS